MTVDTLSEVLRAVRLKGAVFFDVKASGPWVAEAPSGAELAPHVMPGTEHIIEYHVMVQGSCYGGLIGQADIPLSAGDIIVFPQGSAHVMGSAPHMRNEPSWPYTAEQMSRLPIKVDIGTGGPLETHVICGFVGCDRGPFNPLLASLPEVIHVPAYERGQTLQQLAQLAVSESTAPAAGSDCMLSRVSELLFVEIVRRYIALLPDGQTGWLSGLRDTLVGRSLNLLHHRPAHAWTLEELARDAGASRSVLAERFHHLMGVPPMQYLARWRMQLATGLLAGGKALAQVADEVGYGSEAAFSRAFKREVGVAPAQYRRTGKPMAATGG